MSKLAINIYESLKKLFPYYNISTEYYIKYKGHRLFFDFFIKELNILIEVQGRQHDEFVKHFHEDRDGFLRSKKRDNLKKEYCQSNNLVLVEIREEMIADELLNEIQKGIN